MSDNQTDHPMEGVFYTKIRTEFNDGSVIEQNEVRTALIVGFTEQSRGGIKSVDYLEWIFNEEP